ncbi:hypothetical protein [Hymenobacter sp. CRA2]|uniref:hypothetical protein n=1 Tax=Hymenobacter sp. CRA2 TaxID=1955620 RepID=UPI00098F7DA1|nr:hypothetical protein [Hymenobacter sp. CRA2]OON70520.1 hypothetical protein B0919_00370 [Hymenobacter sp. CRA2]
MLRRLPATAAGQQAPVAGRRQGPPPGRGPEQRLDELATSLKLSTQQKIEVKAILQNQRQQMEALRSTGDRDKTRDGLRGLESDTDAKLKAVLSAEQYSKYLAQKPQHGPGGKAPKGGKPGKDPRTSKASS